MIKKALMELLWRLQASQTVIGMVFWPLTITGIFYPYIRERTNNYGFGQGAVLQGMVLTFFIILLLIITFGLIFDKLRFWKEQNIVAVERNPYMSYKLTAKEVYWIRLWALSVKANPGVPPEVKKELEVFERWVEYNLREDGTLRREVEHLNGLVLGGKPGEAGGERPARPPAGNGPS